MQNWCVNPEGQTAERMILTLAGMCNGAATWDGAGFSKLDTAFGHSLAQHAAQGRAWTQKQAMHALKLLNKYRRQLGGTEFMHMWMQNPQFAQMPMGEPTCLPVRALKSMDQTAVFQFGYDAALVAEIRKIRGEHKGKSYWAHWDAQAKCWKVPVNETSIYQIMQFAREYDFDIEERFEIYYSRVVEKREHFKEVAAESEVVTTLGYKEGIHVQDGMITIVHTDPQVLAEFQAVLAKL